MAHRKISVWFKFIHWSSVRPELPYSIEHYHYMYIYTVGTCKRGRINCIFQTFDDNLTSDFNFHVSYSFHNIFVVNMGYKFKL